MPKLHVPGLEERARQLREIGYTRGEIGSLLGVPISTVIFWTHGVTPLKGGKSPEWLKLSDLLDYLQPGVPFKELPLPSGLVAWLKMQSEKNTESLKSKPVGKRKSHHPHPAVGENTVPESQ